MSKLYKRLISAATALLFALSPLTVSAAVPQDVLDEYDFFLNAYPFSEEFKAAKRAEIWLEHSFLGEEIPEEHIDSLNKMLFECTSTEYPIVESDRVLEITNIYSQYRQLFIEYEYAFDYDAGDYGLAFSVAITSKATGELIYISLAERAKTLDSFYIPRWDGIDVPKSLVKGDYLEYMDVWAMLTNPPEIRLPFTEGYVRLESIDIPIDFDPDKHAVYIAPTTQNIVPDEFVVIYGRMFFYTPIEVDSYLIDLTEKPEPDPTEKPEFKFPAGDANKDYLVTMPDASLMLKYIAGWDDVVIDTAVSDTNSDGKITLTDVSYVLKRIAGWKL